MVKQQQQTAIFLNIIETVLFDLLIPLVEDVERRLYIHVWYLNATNLAVSEGIFLKSSVSSSFFSHDRVLYID